MSKVAVFLCIVLCASAANATLFRHTLQRVHDRIGDRIDSTILKVRERFESIQQKAQAVADKIIQDGTQVIEKVRNKLNDQLQKIDNEINKLTGRAQGVDVTECTKLAAHVDDLALAVITNVSVCVNGKLETAVGYVETIAKITNDVMANLSTIREEAFLCGADINGVTSALAAIACANRAAARASWVAAKVVPAITIKVMRLSFLLGTLPPSLTYCTVRNGMISISGESSAVLGKIKKCIHEKIEGVRATTPRIDYTTESTTPETTHSTEESTPDITYTTESSTRESTHSTEEPSSESTLSTDESTTVTRYTTKDSSSESTHTTVESTPEIVSTTETSTPESTSTVEESNPGSTTSIEESTTVINHTTEDSNPASTSTTYEVTAESTSITENSTPEITDTTDEATPEIVDPTEDSTLEITSTTEEAKSEDDVTVI